LSETVFVTGKMDAIAVVVTGGSNVPKQIQYYDFYVLET